jgi:hypothetical protein
LTEEDLWRFRADPKSFAILAFSRPVGIDSAQFWVSTCSTCMWKIQVRTLQTIGATMSGPVSADFFQDLKDGKLRLLTSKVRTDDTLLLAFRGTSINIYYRGGSILRLVCGNGNYTTHFDRNYAKGSADPLLDKLPTVIGTEADCVVWLEAIPSLKEIMNSFFATHAKSEREFQQLVAWENNRSAVSNTTEYFITDIEYADVKRNARLDMLGLRWLSADRKNGLRCSPVFVEMKYGIGAYDGGSGIAKHIADLNAILSDQATRDHLNLTIAAQFNQLSGLDLVRFNRSTKVDQVTVTGDPEVVFLLANHNPRSRTLLNTLENVEESPHFKLRFFAASFAGYGMHDSCMMNLTEFKERVSSYLN